MDARLCVQNHETSLQGIEHNTLMQAMTQWFTFYNNGGFLLSKL